MCLNHGTLSQPIFISCLNLGQKPKTKVTIWEILVEFLIKISKNLYLHLVSFFNKKKMRTFSKEKSNIFVHFEFLNLIENVNY